LIFYSLSPSFLSVLLKRPRPYVILNTLFFIMLGSYSILKGGIQISFAGVCFLIFLTIFSVVLISFLRLLTVIPVFWFIRLWAIQDVLNKFVQFMRYPAKVFALPLRIGLFVVLPVLAASYIPASIFVIGFNWLQALYLMIITYIFVIITKAFWKAGLKKYGSASS
jgi:ABC-2 type transport system permease protein